MFFSAIISNWFSSYILLFSIFLDAAMLNFLKVGKEKIVKNYFYYIIIKI